MNNQRDFTGVITIVSIMLGVFVVGTGVYFVKNRNLSPFVVQENVNSSILNENIPVDSSVVEKTETSVKPDMLESAVMSEPVDVPVVSTPVQTTEVRATGITFISSSLTSSQVSGLVPLTVNINGRIVVPTNQNGKAIIFFGDGVSDIMFRSSPEIFEEIWNHTYKKAGTYEAMLVLTSVSDVDSDIQVMKDPHHPKNLIVKKLQIKVTDTNN